MPATVRNATTVRKIAATWCAVVTKKRKEVVGSAANGDLHATHSRRQPLDARKPLARPATFRTAADVRAWLEAHHGTARELLVRCYNNHARRQGLTNLEALDEALDEALCFGWIDGVRGRECGKGRENPTLAAPG